MSRSDAAVRSRLTCVCVSGFQDDMEAYRTQNRFLNSEIYQLTRLWRTSSEQEKSLMMKVSPAAPSASASVPCVSAFPVL